MKRVGSEASLGEKKLYPAKSLLTFIEQAIQQHTLNIYNVQSCMLVAVVD